MKKVLLEAFRQKKKADKSIQRSRSLEAFRQKRKLIKEKKRKKINKEKIPPSSSYRIKIREIWRKIHLISFGLFSRRMKNCSTKRWWMITPKRVYCIIKWFFNQARKRKKYDFLEKFLPLEEHKTDY